MFKSREVQIFHLLNCGMDAPNVNYFKVFVSKCYILKDAKNIKLDAKSDEGIFFGHSIKNKMYKCLNFNNNEVLECENIRVD